MVYNLIIIALTALFLIRQFKYSFIKGASWTLFLLILVPQYTGIRITDTIPLFPAHRFYLLLLFYFCLINQSRISLDKKLKVLIVLLLLTNLASLMLSTYKAPAFKGYLSLLIENMLVFIVVSSSIYRIEDIRHATRLIYNSLIIITIFCIIENSFGIKLLHVLPAYQNLYLEQKANYVTFPHPILLGTALAIGLVLSVLFMVRSYNIKRNIYVGWINIFLFGVGLYFSFSRGPWLAGMIGLSIMYLFAGFGSKKIIILLMMIPLAVFQINPGVQGTVADYYEKTMQIDSLEGSSFIYRFELLYIAIEQISMDIIRTCFGYGLDYHNNRTFYGEYKSIPGKMSYFRSWDNEFAALLLETGVVGLFIILLFYFRIIFLGIRNYRQSIEKHRANITAYIAGTIIVIFMMTNVKMFSYQLLFLFYAMSAFSINYGRIGENGPMGTNETLVNVTSTVFGGRR